MFIRHPQSMARLCEKSIFPRVMMACHSILALFIIIIIIIFPTHPLSDTTSPLRGCKSLQSSLAVPCSTAGLWSSARQDWVGKCKTACKQDIHFSKIFSNLKWTGFSASHGDLAECGWYKPFLWTCAHKLFFLNRPRLCGRGAGLASCSKVAFVVELVILNLFQVLKYFCFS